MKNNILILLFVFSITLCGCASRVYSISDVKGTWESINYAYYYLEIKKNGPGYLGFSMDANDVECYKITDIKFVEDKFIITFQNLDHPDKFLKLGGILFGEDCLILGEPESADNNDSKNSKKHLIF